MAFWRKSSVLGRAAIPVVLVAGALAGPVGAAYAADPSASAAPAGNDVRSTGDEQVAPGVTFSSFMVTTTHGQVVGYRVTADLRNPNVGLNLLHPDAVAESEPVSRMVLGQQAVAGTNGDFFNISETHAGVPPTFSSDGPEIAAGTALKANVPDGQRFGPALPPGTTTEDVFGTGADGRARVSTLDLSGQVLSRLGPLALKGLNQYALPVNGIGVYTHDWGTVSRLRATCGTDTNGSAPCSTDTEEVVVDHGVVTSVATQPGAGAIAPDAEVLVGREAGADRLRSLVPGDHVAVNYRLATTDVPPFTFAVGGFPILRGGSALASLDPTTLAPRTSAGTSADGRTVYLVAVDGRSATSAGMTLSELAGLMQSFGATDAVNLDGGGSTELATRQPGSQQVTVRNSPSDGAERPVANGVGVFVR
jgi:hypothetical protein